MDNIKKGDFLFVYGTLRRGERADLARSQGSMEVEFQREDRIAGRIYNLGSYPGVKNASDFADSGIAAAGIEPGDSLSEVITGDLFKCLDDSIGVILDHYEGFPYLYDRQKVQTESGHTAWVYTYNHDVTADQLIPSGDWTRRHEITEKAA